MPLTGKASAPTIMQPTAKAYDEAPWRKRVDRPEQPVTPPRKPPQPQGPPLQQVRSPCLADWSLLPKEYGYWNWDDDTAMLEDEVATKYDMPWKLRGPPAPPNGGPELWLGLPFHTTKGVWGYMNRKQLPPTYAFEDWWTPAAMHEEARLAKLHRISWDLRGPPHGPVLGGPKTWRNMEWRANSEKWMTRGGSKKDEYDKYYKRK